MKAALLSVLFVVLALPATAACRQALALGLDVSGSVDTAEYRLQLDGLAAALEDESVQAAILASPQVPVRLMIYEWSGSFEQRLLLDWTDLAHIEQIAGIADRLRATQPAHTNDPSTAIGRAMMYGAAELRQQADCWRRTLDISGDGPSNTGPHPRDLDGGDLNGITVNGLVIGPAERSNITKDLTDVKSLESYYRSYVLRGPGAFLETALGHSDFALAMRRKLLREIEAPVLSRLRAQ